MLFSHRGHVRIADLWQYFKIIWFIFCYCAPVMKQRLRERHRVIGT